MKYYAHSKKDRPPEEWQPLDEHLKNVAEIAADFAGAFKSEDWAWNAGILHDIGKATNAFQAYLKQCNQLDDSEYDADGSVSNHASAGAAMAEKNFGKQIGRILSYLSAGHHAGLPDWHSAETGNAALCVRMEEGRRNLAYIRDMLQDIGLNLKPLAKPPDFVAKSEDFHLWVRMLFSCLVDADYLDTEKFVSPQKISARGKFPALDELAEKFFQSLAELEETAKPTPVNKIRAEIRQACEAATEKSPGMFSLTVPTGGGKTLSAMAFALRHAMKYGQKRIIYVIPYTSIIEQTAQVLGDIFGRENVVEHHSNLSPENETERSQLAAENWDAPVIITTNVQFFESLYSAKSGRCRKLHNIINSIVILDEAQLLPPKWLTPCVDVMNRLVKDYCVTMVLATATQPALQADNVQPPLPALDRMTPIIPKELNLYDRLKRTDISLPENSQKINGWPEIAEQLQKHDQALCVVNTRRDCYDLSQRMPEGTVHLSGLMCGEHRSNVIKDIKNRLHFGKPIRVVSTQLVEAGVDLDFPVVYRAMAGLDSIAQAAGRCNREGKLNELGRMGQVYVFCPPKSAPLGLLRKGEDKMREMLSIPGFDPQKPEFYTRYFELFYSAVNDTGANWLKDLLVRDVNPDLFFQFRTAGQQFKLIEDADNCPVFVDYAGSDKWLDDLRLIGPTRENMRALQRFAVNLRKHSFERARNDGLLEEIWKDFWLWAPKYDPVVGLDIFGAGWAPEDCIQ